MTGGDEYNVGGWHLKKEVSVGHLLTTLALAGAVVTYIIQNESRLATLEANDAAASHERMELRAVQGQRFDQLERWMASQFTDIKIELRTLRAERRSDARE